MKTIEENSITQTNIEIEVVDSSKNNVFAFWESDSEMPAYLKLFA